MSNTTTFSKNEQGEWSWHTQSSNGEITGDAGGYNTDAAALNGYFSQQGFPDWRPGDTLPEGYELDHPDPNTIVITQQT